MANPATNELSLLILAIVIPCLLVLAVGAWLGVRQQRLSRQRYQQELALLQQQYEDHFQQVRQQDQQLHAQALEQQALKLEQAQQLSQQQQLSLQQDNQRLEQVLDQAQLELKALQQQLSESQQQILEKSEQQVLWQSRADANQQQREDLNQRLQQSQQQVEEYSGRINELELALTTLQETQQQQQQHHQEKLALLEDNKAQLLKEFELLSQKIFEQKTKQINDQGQQGLNNILQPFKEQLQGLRQRVDQVHSEDTKQRVSLQEQLSHLQTLNQQMSSEAQALTNALKGDQKTQGNWGELVLETVLEKSGLREGQEFQREQAERNEDGKLYRPDVVIHLPDGKHIIIDSKVSLTAYAESVGCNDPEQQQQLLKNHVASVRQHIRSLSDKAYQQLKGLNSPDFVFLFMPIEPAFMTAFQMDEGLFNEAFERRIVVVTPTTLLATLKTVASIWAIERRNKSTEKLADKAGKLYDKLVVVVDRMQTLGKQLTTVSGTWDDAMKSLSTGQGNIITQADQFRKLGVRVKKELAKSLVEEANAEHELHAQPEQLTASEQTQVKSVGKSKTPAENQVTAVKTLNVEFDNDDVKKDGRKKDSAEKQQEMNKQSQESLL